MELVEWWHEATSGSCCSVIGRTIEAACMRLVARHLKGFSEGTLLAFQHDTISWLRLCWPTNKLHSSHR